MSIKKKREIESSLGNAESPYIIDDSTDIDECYHRHLNDPTRKQLLGGRLFYKVFYRQPLYVHDKHEALVWFDNVVADRTGEILLDEFGHRFTVVGIAMYRFVNGCIPDWYLKADGHLLSGDIGAMGEYLTNTDERLCRCLRPPKTGSFKRDELYRWTYIIDALRVFDDAGTQWEADELCFSTYFTIVNGKR